MIAIRDMLLGEEEVLEDGEVAEGGEGAVGEKRGRSSPPASWLTGVQGTRSCSAASEDFSFTNVEHTHVSLVYA